MKKVKFNKVEKYIWENVAGLSRTLTLQDFDDYISDGYFYDSAKPNHFEINKVVSVTEFKESLEKVNNFYLEMYNVN